MANTIVYLKWVSEKGPESKSLDAGGVISLGREPGNDIVIPLVSISRNHATIEAIGENFVISDLGSANGTYVNGHRVGRAPWILKDGDRITLDTFVLTFELVESKDDVNPPVPVVKKPQPAAPDQPRPNPPVAPSQPISRPRPTIQGPDTARLNLADAPQNPSSDVQRIGRPSENTQPRPKNLPQTMGLRRDPPEKADATIVNAQAKRTDYFPRPKVPHLVVSQGADAGRSFDLTSDVIILGRVGLLSNWDIQINDAGVGNPHARLEKRSGNYWLTDLGNLPPTLINGTQIVDQVCLMEGDLITLGDNTRMIYRRE